MMKNQEADHSAHGRRARAALHIPLWLIPLALSLLAACSEYTRTSNVNISQTYERSADRPDVDFRVHAVSDSSAHVYARIAATQLAMLSETGNRIPVLRWGLFAGFKADSPADTGRFIPFPGHFGEDPYIIFTDTIRLADKGEYNLHFRLVDGMGKEYEYLSVFSIHAWGSPSRLLPLDGNGNIRFTDYASPDDTLYIGESGQWRVNYYAWDAPPALPPFAGGSTRLHGNHPDSSFLSEGTLIPVKTGIYHLVMDSLSGMGYSFSVFDKGFPWISTAEQMIESTRYIMTKREYEECLAAPDPKAAIDAFWLGMCGNMVRARKQMAAYYTGVEMANKMFSSHIEGWKTDRGMMYIVLGKPDMVYRSASTETWMYGEIGYSRSLSLNFIRSRSEFGTDEYRLERMPTLKDSWYHSVNNWRR